MATTSNIRDIQLKILNILSEVDKACQTHHLRYYMMAGTLLGAVRHKGFIPWDDDLDIGMPRADYEIFTQKWQEFLPQHLEMVHGENDIEYPLSFAKIQDASTTLIERIHLKYTGGIYIDVFPLDGVPSGRLAQMIHFTRFAFYNKLLYFIYRDPYKHGHGASSWIPRLSRFLFSRQQVQKTLKKIMTRFDFDASENICDYDDGIKGILPKYILGEPTPILFEGREFWGVKDYHAYLSNKYGDYMQIPDKAHQRQHNFYFLDLNKPYREQPEERQP